MTRERAKAELEQIYGMLSSEKQQALDVAFKALDGITPTVVAEGKTFRDLKQEVQLMNPIMSVWVKIGAVIDIIDKYIKESEV